MNLRMNSRTSRPLTPWSCLALLALAATYFAAGCLPLDGSEVAVTGTVNGQAFDAISGEASAAGAGAYVITLADTSEISCSAVGALPATYLTVDIGQIDQAPKTFQAADVVGFNHFLDSVSTSEAATSGTVTIEAIDEVTGVITGVIEASGPNSSVSGDFTVDICF